ncbi:MAG: hypothetical protein HRU49_08755 [Winogradskyella sp.]|uniref:hypothetical protein n=1 Tax=Winogradskyella sp. TaxID=1883156 RepID=UPI0025CF9895|nr:hypothetical protein [Winogradskyella sp.]NRB83849.1 hypothetical protein [Winogradskyella sp.]
MKYLKYALLLSTTILSSCFGDKTTIVGEELGTELTENKSFSGNKYSFKELPENLCTIISMDEVKQQYIDANVNEVKVDQVRRFSGKYCDFMILFDPSMATAYSKGFLSVVKDFEGDSNWQEQWQFKLKSLKSAESVPNLGKAALWIGKQRKLEVKMDGYTIVLTVPAINGVNDPNARQYDYKSTAVSIIKNSKFF